MAMPYAYSETHKKNISLDEAYNLFFAQTGIRKRFTFLCGDPDCRKAMRPLVIGVGYDKPKGVAHQSPNFRENHTHKHLDSCTWVNNNKKTNKKSISAFNKSSSWIGSGFTFIPEPQTNGNSTQQSVTKSTKIPNQRELPQSSRFIYLVGSRYLSYSDNQRKSTELTIENIEKGNFHTICIPINGFHPYYQSKRIYFGKVEIVELNYVFLIRFRSGFASDGDSRRRNLRPEIKLLKSVLNVNDAAMRELLHNLSTQREQEIYCFFYITESPIELDVNGKKVGRFEMHNLSHIAIIPISAISSNKNIL